MSDKMPDEIYAYVDETCYNVRTYSMEPDKGKTPYHHDDKYNTVVKERDEYKSKSLKWAEDHVVQESVIARLKSERDDAQELLKDAIHHMKMQNHWRDILQGVWRKAVQMHFYKYEKEKELLVPWEQHLEQKDGE